MAAEDLIAKRDERVRANLLAVALTAYMAVCEWFVIRGMWFTMGSHADEVERFVLPFITPFPALLLLLFQWQAREWVAQGKMASGLSTSIMKSFALAVFFGYFCTLVLAETACRTR